MARTLYGMEARTSGPESGGDARAPFRRCPDEKRRSICSPSDNASFITTRAHARAPPRSKRFATVSSFRGRIRTRVRVTYVGGSQKYVGRSFRAPFSRVFFFTSQLRIRPYSEPRTMPSFTARLSSLFLAIVSCRCAYGTPPPGYSYNTDYFTVPVSNRCNNTSNLTVLGRSKLAFHLTVFERPVASRSDDRFYVPPTTENGRYLSSRF